MESTEVETVCPHCREVHPLATSVKPGGDHIPNNGDVSICFKCGGVSIFNRKIDGHLRLPTATEAKNIADDDDIQAALTAWRLVMRP